MMTNRILSMPPTKFESPVNLVTSQNHDAIGISNGSSLLWNVVPCGEPLLFGIRHFYQLYLFCVKRCLRLAYRHACQEGLEDNVKNAIFHGFFLGKASQSDDERGFLIKLDRFDPGTIQSDGSKMPSGPLPGDVVVPFVLMMERIYSVNPSVWLPENYHNSSKGPFNEVPWFPFENAGIVSLRLLAIIKKESLECNEVNMELQWSAPCISNSICSSPINQIPIIPNALSRNLARPISGSSSIYFETGFIAADPSQRFVLLPDSSSNFSSVETVGIWIRGVSSIHSPLVWLTCMKYLHSPYFHERSRVEDYFFVILYSTMAQSPLYFQVTSDDNDKLNFLLIHSEELIRLPKECVVEMEDPFEFHFKISPIAIPSSSSKEREKFSNQKLPVGQIAACLKTNASEDVYISDSNDLHPYERDIYSHLTPMPLPSPHAISQSTTVKPSVPELSVIFGENFPTSPPKEFSKMKTPRTINVSTDATLRSIENFTESGQLSSCSDATPDGGKLHVDCQAQYPLYQSITPKWMENVPPQARQLIMDQDVQLRKLRSQVKKLLIERNENLQEEQIKSFNNDAVTVSEMLSSVVTSEETRQDTNGKLSMSKSKKANKEHASLSGIPQLPSDVPDEKSSCSVSAVSQYTSPVVLPDVKIIETKETAQVECNNKHSTERSEFASIHLDETNLHDILTANNGDGVASHGRSSPFNIDLPALETSTDQSPSVSLHGKIQCRNIWDAQDSPILGESASTCVVFPIKFPKFSQKPESTLSDGNNPCEDVKDEEFMKTILDQVSNMLPKPNENSSCTTELSGQSLSIPPVKASVPVTSACHHKVATPTKREYHKTDTDDGIQETNLALAGSDQAKEVYDDNCIHSKASLPRLTKLSSIWANSSSGNTCAVLSATAISMNAIVRKYLSNDRLEEVTPFCRQDNQFSTMFSLIASDIHDDVSYANLMRQYQNLDDSKMQVDGDLPGLSLVSASNMSLATRRYMEKYGLIDKTTANGSCSSEDVSGTSQSSQSSLVLQKSSLRDIFHRGTNSGLENERATSHQAEQPRVQEIEFDSRKDTGMEQRFSQLKINLGDTLDMILPFLDDLDKRKQQSPSSESSHERWDQGSGCNVGEADGLTERSDGKKSSNENVPDGAKKIRKTLRQEEKEDASQVLSLEILQAVAQYRKTANQPHGSGVTSSAPQANIISTREVQ